MTTFSKPFEMDELAARVRSAIRSRSMRADPVLRSRTLVLHPDAKVVTKEGVVVSLSAREFALLELLMRRPGCRCHAANSKNACSAGEKKWPAMRWK